MISKDFNDFLIDLEFSFYLITIFQASVPSLLKQFPLAENRATGFGPLCLFVCFNDAVDFCIFCISTVTVSEPGHGTWVC